MIETLKDNAGWWVKEQIKENIMNKSIGAGMGLMQ